MPKPAAALMTLADVRAFLDREFPQISHGDMAMQVEAVGAMSCRMRMPFHARYLRPGGTISGPSMFALADVALYVAILAQIGPVALTVTTSLNINFLKKPGHSDLIGECRLLKLGRRLAVGEVSLFSDQSADMVAHATGTYSIPG